jgi:subtilisin family serine protease
VYQDGKAHETATETAPSWGLDRIDQRSLPLNNTYSYSGTGAKVHIYIEDSGILYTHEDFGGRAKLGIDTVGDGQKGNDCDGHGTMVAGIAAGKKYGVAKSAALISVRVFDCRGWTDWSDILKGIDWITANAKKPAVANLSLGGGPNAVVDAAIEKSIASGVTYVVAAGNDNRDACKGTPERIPAVLSVAAVDKTDKRASSSQWGTCVDLFAPGVAVDSDGIGSNTATRLGGGTSAASPFVAGSAAVYLGEHPTATPAQVMAAIVGSATPNVVKDPGTGTPNKLLFTG